MQSLREVVSFKINQIFQAWKSSTLTSGLNPDVRNEDFHAGLILMPGLRASMLDKS